MFGKILLSIYFVGLSQAVFIDPAENHDKDLNKENPHGWQMVKVYHPPNNQAFGYKYEPYAYPKYEFEYSVSDKKTGDQKHHRESRDGDRVRGEYSLVESDGSLRKVQYHADDHNGFNAIVSKTINKHGDHAVSVSDHTRFFYPVGNGIKINHYFPGKNYHYQDIRNPQNNKESIPVHEEKESSEPKIEEAKMQVIDLGEKIVLVEPQQAEKVAPTPKSEVVEVMPVNVVPAVVSVASQNSETETINNENSLHVVDKTDILPTPSKDLPLTNEDKTNEKENQHLDSEVASSFYHSKIYYIAY